MSINNLMQDSHNIKLCSWIWWFMPVIPAAQKAEVGGSWSEAMWAKA
jgi:hypothetical protein